VAKHKPELIDRNVVETIMRFQKGGTKEKPFDFSARGKLLVEIVKSRSKFVRRISGGLRKELKVKRQSLYRRALYAAETLKQIDDIVSEVVDMDEVYSQLERLKETLKGTPRFLTVATKLHSALIDEKDIQGFMGKNKSKEFKFDDLDTLQALGSLVKLKKSAITSKFVEEVIDQSTSSLELEHSESVVDVLYALSQISDKYHDLVISGLFDKINDENSSIIGSFIAGPLLNGLMKKNDSIAKEILGNTVIALKRAGNNYMNTSMPSLLSLITAASKVVPSEFDDDVLDQIFKVIDAPDRLIAISDAQNRLAEVAYEVFKIDQTRGKRILARATKKPEGERGRIFEHYGNDSHLDFETIPFILKVSPELLTENMFNMAMEKYLHIPASHDLNMRDWREDLDRISAGKVISEIYKFRPDLFSSQILLKFYSNNPSGWIRISGAADPLPY